MTLFNNVSNHDTTVTYQTDLNSLTNEEHLALADVRVDERRRDVSGWSGRGASDEARLNINSDLWLSVK